MLPKMTEVIIKQLKDLKERPKYSDVDHILILHLLYSEYDKGFTELKPIVAFYLNGFDDFPALKEKQLWNSDSYEEIMQPFYEAHSKLVTLVDKVLEKYGN